MATRSIIIQIKLVNTSNQSIAILCVEAWDKDFSFSDLTGSAETNEFFNILFIRKISDPLLQI